MPRGLSLFRFFLFSGLMVGAAYGGASLYLGSPPYPGHRLPDGTAAAEWEPSPLWAPVYLAVKAGGGILHTPQGYQYRGPLGRALFGGLAIGLGMLLGGAAGWLAGECGRREVLRRRERERAERQNRPGLGPLGTGRGAAEEEDALA